jgi:ribose/xylose/arabinose/galactoside ABC-type transport system permease subunit
MSADGSGTRPGDPRAGQLGAVWTRIYHHQLFWPVAVLVALLVLNVSYRPSFISLTMLQGHLYGSIIDIIRHAAPLILVALGMTLVIATRGIDLSVGAVAAIAGAMACLHISKQEDQSSVAGVVVALLLGVLVALACGLWNGVLVAGMGIQPIIATLILMVAGRGVAQLITSGQIITIRSPAYAAISTGYWLALPIAIFIAAAVVAGVARGSRRTGLGVILE